MNELKKKTTRKSVPNTKRVEQKINNRRKKKTGQLALFAVLFIALIAVLVWIALSPICNVRSVVTEGVSEKKSAKIIKNAGIVIDENVFKQAGDNVFECMFLTFSKHEYEILSRNPNLESVDISYNFLGKVIIDVVERSPFVVIEGKVNKKTAKVLVDDKFYVYENRSNKKWSKYISVEGFNIKSTELSSKAIEEDALKVAALKSFLEVLKDEMIAQKKIVKSIDRIKISDENKIEFYINNVRVILGDLDSLSITEKRYKFDFLAQVIKKIEPDEKGTLNLSIGKDAVFKPSK